MASKDEDLVFYTQIETSAHGAIGVQTKPDSSPGFQIGVPRWHYLDPRPPVRARLGEAVDWGLCEKSDSPRAGTGTCASFHEVPKVDATELALVLSAAGAARAL
jgi:hypothetical protein